MNVTEELTISSPAQSFVEPLKLPQLKNYLNVTRTNDDEQLNDMITAAREIAEGYQNRDLVVKQYDRNYQRCYPYPCVVELRRPLQSVDLIQKTGREGNVTTLVEGTDYCVEATFNAIRWLRIPSDAVLIRFTAGYPANHTFWRNSGRRVLVGMKQLITAWQEDRLPYAERGKVELPFGVTSCLSFGAHHRVSL